MTNLKKNPWKRTKSKDSLDTEDYVLYNTPQDEQEVFQEIVQGSSYKTREVYFDDGYSY